MSLPAGAVPVEYVGRDERIERIAKDVEAGTGLIPSLDVAYLLRAHKHVVRLYDLAQLDIAEFKLEKNAHSSVELNASGESAGRSQRHGRSAPAEVASPSGPRGGEQINQGDGTRLLSTEVDQHQS